MAGRVEGKVALITGAGTGQGRAHAVTLAREGADIIATDVGNPKQVSTIEYSLAGQDDLAETVSLVEQQGRRAIAATVDVRSQEQLDAAVERGIAEFGHIDIVIANAAIFNKMMYWEISEQDWDDMIEINLTGAWKTAKAVASHLRERRTGTIIFISSVDGLRGGAGAAHYVASKHGVIGLMRGVALELADYNVRVNAICPGAIATAMTSWLKPRPEFPKGAAHFHALPGGAKPPEVVADAALWLASDEASAVTGVALPVDAGFLALHGYNPTPPEEVPAAVAS